MSKTVLWFPQQRLKVSLWPGEGRHLKGDLVPRYVLFTAHGVFVEDWERLGKEYLDIDPSTIFAYVDVVENPTLKKRFNIKELPQAILFRDRKVRHSQRCTC